jgi:nucleotide-binding universal stress UspA family protein
VLKKVLIPVDFTAKNERAFAAARELVDHEGGEIVLVHVVESLEDELDDDLRNFYRKLERRAEERMTATLGKLGVGAFARRGEVILGHRARAIVDFAAKEVVDAIVLSSHRVDPDKPGADWMTISYKVAILARCPVLLVK